MANYFDPRRTMVQRQDTKINLWDPNIAWYQYPEDLFKGLDFVRFVMCKYAVLGGLSYFHIAGNYVLGSDDLRICRYKLKHPAPFSMVLHIDPKTIISSLRGWKLLGVTKIKQGIAFKFPDIRVWCYNCDDNNLVDRGNEFFEGRVLNLIKIPKKAQDIARYMRRVSKKPLDFEIITVTISEDKITFFYRGKKEINADCRIKKDTSRMPISFEVNARHFAESITRASYLGCIKIDPNRLYFKNECAEQVLGCTFL